jgi:hypothetical protein
MKHAIWLLMGLVFTVSARADPSDSRADALELVRLVGLEEAMAIATNAKSKRDFDAGRLDAAQFKCAATFEPAQFTDDLVGLVQTVLSAKQLDDALYFYRSDAGRALSAHELAGIEAKHNLTGKPVPEPTPLTADQNEEIEAFGRTNTGRKLIETGVLILTPEAKGILDKHMRAARERCGSPPANKGR